MFIGIFCHVLASFVILTEVLKRTRFKGMERIEGEPTVFGLLFATVMFSFFHGPLLFTLFYFAYVILWILSKAEANQQRSEYRRREQEYTRDDIRSGRAFQKDYISLIDPPPVTDKDIRSAMDVFTRHDPH